jgi:hypothetical protein
VLIQEDAPYLSQNYAWKTVVVGLGRLGVVQMMSYEILESPFSLVIPAKAGIHNPCRRRWIPASAGMTGGQNPSGNSIGPTTSR